MVSSTRIAIMIAIILILKSTTVGSRELRPSDHGLDYQTRSPSTGTTSQETKSFFKGSSSMSSPSTSDNVALPRAMNSTDTSWWRDDGGGVGGRDRVRHVMLIASVVCGATGVILLVASAFIYFFRYRTRRQPSSSSLSLVVYNDNTNNPK